MDQPRVLVLSDVSVGYAVPQMILMARAIGALLNAKVTLVEPDMKGRVELCETDGIDFQRISTRNPPHDLVFHVEYVRAINEIYRQNQPDVLIVFNAAVLAPLLLNARRPKCVIYYMLESLDHQLTVGGQHFFDLNRMASELIDLVIVPEKRRYAIDAARLGWQNVPALEVLNIGSETTPRASFPDRCRFLFAGTLNKHTGLDWLTDERLSHLDIDVAGPCDSEESRNMVAEFLACSTGGSERRYLGLLSHKELLSRLHDYAYRLVFWTASDINTLYASPNKFFESVSYYLPPISTPHPQMLEINRLYGCSVLMSDFSKEAAVEAILDAELIFYSDSYLRLLKGCVSASRERLNWPKQFGPVAEFLRKSLPNVESAPHINDNASDLLAREEARLVQLWHRLRPRRPDGDGDTPSANHPSASASPVYLQNDPLALAPAAPEETSEVVDSQWYLGTYPDVRALGMTAEEHFHWIGRELGRAPNAHARGRRERAGVR